MKKLHFLTATVLLATMWAARAQNVPAEINYQGQLVDGTGTPLPNGNYDLTFRIYSADPGGSLLWGPQVAHSVALVGGRFNVILGPTDSGGLAVTTAFSNAVTYLEIQVGANSPISPRQQVLSAPYALQAENSEYLAGYGWDAVFSDTGRPDTGHLPGAKIADASITSSQISPGAITTSQLANGAVTAANIAAGAVGAVQIASGAVGTQQIADGAVGTAQIASGAVGPDQIASGAVGTAQIAAGAVGTAQITNGAVTAAKLNLQTGNVAIGQASAFYPLDVASSGGFAIHSANSGTYFFATDPSYAIYAGGKMQLYGNANITGTLTKSGGAFKIDHPLDPANKYLSHSFVESPDMKNIYDGVATLDAQGKAEVVLPEWFEALNKDFRYQLTAIGGAAPNLHIGKKISSNRFSIAGGFQGLEVSWQVTGTRQDAWAKAHRIPVEEMKPEAERGFYLAPELFGQSQEKNVRLARHPAAEPAQQ